MTKIKPIETVYKGYRFRSRLEARWAVFFDALGLKYEYEKEGFEINDSICYLPDFYLPDSNRWVEVKGTLLSDDEIIKCESFCEAKDPDVKFSIVIGLPHRPVIFGAESVGIASFTYSWQAEEGTEHTENGKTVNGPLIPSYIKFLNNDLTQNPIPTRFMPASWIGNWEDSKLDAAIDAAKGARFEHGEKPVVKK